MSQEASTPLARSIRTRLSDGAPLDSLAQELAALHARIEALSAEVRVLKAQRTLRDALLPQAQVAYRGLSAARVDAGMPLDESNGLYHIEYDGHGHPFRWTGPAPSFHFDLHLDRSGPLRFTLVAGHGVGQTHEPLRAFCDGAELPLEMQEAPDRTEYAAVLLPRETLGLSRLQFLVPTTFKPPGDVRTLGVTFKELLIMPTSVEAAQAYLAACDDLTQLLLENPTGAIGADEAVPGGAEDSVVKPLPRRPKHKRGGQR